jgi:hypothetical protein
MGDCWPGARRRRAQRTTETWTTVLLGASESLGENGLFVDTDEATHHLYRRGTAPYGALPRLSAADPVPRAGSPVDGHPPVSVDRVDCSAA